MSCSHCSGRSSLKTECCGRIYCGEECLKSDLVQHDLECIEFNPFKRKQDAPDLGAQIITIKRNDNRRNRIYVYRTKEIRNNAFDSFKTYKAETKLSVSATDSFTITNETDAKNFVAKYPTSFFIRY